MAHRDLKPLNILTNSKGELKLGDFGSAIEPSDKRQKTTPGTPEYCSPQQRKNLEHTNKCDVYALGCIFFHLLTGTTPKRAKCTKEKKIGNIMDMAKLKNKLKNSNVPENFINFMEGCLR